MVIKQLLKCKIIILAISLFYSNISLANSHKYIVFNYENDTILEKKDIAESHSMASLTKLMTAFVYLKYKEIYYDKELCYLKIDERDNDNLKHTTTRLQKNKLYSCDELMKVMLIASDNYAASALSRAFGTTHNFINLMNKEAKNNNMLNTFFEDVSGLSNKNRSNLIDLKKMTELVIKNEIIKNISSTKETVAIGKNKQIINIQNTNVLIREDIFLADISKTGYIKESGYNLIFVPKNCKNKIAIITLGHNSSVDRANFVEEKVNNLCNSEI